MCLIRAMENGKPGQLGGKECTFPYKTNKQTSDCESAYKEPEGWI